MVWLSGFLRQFDIGERERTAIELRTLVRCVWLAGTYDQLNGPSLACIEEVSLRICQLVDAYESGTQGRPNWTTVKHYTNVQSATSVVPRELRSYAHRLCKEEVEAANLQVRAAGAVPFLATEDGKTTPAAPPADKTKKGKGEGKRARQLAAAEQAP